MAGSVIGCRPEVWKAQSVLRADESGLAYTSVNRLRNGRNAARVHQGQKRLVTKGAYPLCCAAQPSIPSLMKSAAGIRQLQAAAVIAGRTGYPDAAEAILEIVEAAEAALATTEG
jgi:hypothetical protein